MKHSYFVASILIVLFVSSCTQSYVPRPYGYFRVDLPENAYRPLGDTLNLPYTFDISKYANVTKGTNRDEDIKNAPFWIDITYPSLNAVLYCSYKALNGDLYEVSEDTRKIVYKHSIRADGIGAEEYEDPTNHVYGILYDLDGNTATTVQFVMTDSVHHFFRGAVYFNNVPNEDSIAPMAEFIQRDVQRIMESFRWTRQ